MSCLCDFFQDQQYIHKNKGIAYYSRSRHWEFDLLFLPMNTKFNCEFWLAKTLLVDTEYITSTKKEIYMNRF